MNNTTNRRKSNRAYPLEKKEVLINDKRFILKDISREAINHALVAT